jgi:pyruvate-ferredoxin/flavodoxin oxidoreductase
MLKELARVEKVTTSTIDIEDKIRKEVVGKIAKGLMQLAGDNGAGIV